MIVYIFISIILVVLSFIFLFPHIEEQFRDGKNIVIKGDRPCDINVSPEKIQEISRILKDRIRYWGELRKRSVRSYRHSYGIYRRYISRRSTLQRNLRRYRSQLTRGNSIKSGYQRKISSYNTQIQGYQNRIGSKRNEIAGYRSTINELRKKVGTLPDFRKGFLWKRVNGYNENAGWLSGNKGIVESGTVDDINNIVFAFKAHSNKLNNAKRNAINNINKRYNRYRYSWFFRRIWNLRRQLEINKVNRDQRYNINNQGISERETYCVEIVGYFRANTTGNYRFALNSDDFSYLWIGHENDMELPVSRFSGVGGRMSSPSIHNGGAHGMRKRYSPNVYMIKGKYYPVRIQFGERTGGDNLIFSFIEPNNRERTNGSGFFFNSSGGGGGGGDINDPFKSFSAIKENYGAIDDLKKNNQYAKSAEDTLNNLINIYNITRRNRDNAVRASQRAETQKLNAQRNISNTERSIGSHNRVISRYSRSYRYHLSRSRYYNRRRLAVLRYYRRTVPKSTIPIDGYKQSNINLYTQEETPLINDRDNVVNWAKCYRRARNDREVSREQNKMRRIYTPKMEVEPYRIQSGELYSQLQFRSQDPIDYIPKNIVATR